MNSNRTLHHSEECRAQMASVRLTVAWERSVEYEEQREWVSYPDKMLLFCVEIIFIASSVAALGWLKKVEEENPDVSVSYCAGKGWDYGVLLFSHTLLFSIGYSPVCKSPSDHTQVNDCGPYRGKSRGVMGVRWPFFCWGLVIPFCWAEITNSTHPTENVWIHSNKPVYEDQNVQFHALLSIRWRDLMIVASVLVLLARKLSSALREA